MNDKPLSRNLARNVALLRQERGFTKKEMCARLAEAGMPLTHMGLHRLEREQRKVTIDEWQLLALALGVEPGRLLADAPTCKRCNDAPPPGYSCLTCGAEGLAP